MNNQQSERRYRIAADIGGTFTDVAFLGEDGVLAIKKVLSTPDDYAAAVVDGVVVLGEVESCFTIDREATDRRRRAMAKEASR